MARILGLAGMVGSVALPPSLEGQSLAWSGSLQYSQGSYIFTETTRSWSLYSALTLQGSRARLSLGVPVVVQDSRAITFVGELPIPTGGPDSEVVSRRRDGEPIPMGGRRGGGGPGAAGQLAFQTTTPVDSVEAPGSYTAQLADPVVSGSLQLLAPRRGFLGLDLTGSVKIPVRDLDSGVGTGEVDVGVGLSGAAGRAPWMFFGDVGWWRYGDLPELPLKDVFSYGVGVGRVLGSRVSALVSLSGSTGILEEVSPPAELSGMLSWTVGDGRSVNVGVGVGLTEASPDLALSVGSRITLLNR